MHCTFSVLLTKMLGPRFPYFLMLRLTFDFPCLSKSLEHANLSFLFKVYKTPNSESNTSKQ